MTRDRATEWLMSHDVPRPSRRRTRGWLNFGTKPPRCDVCKQMRAPGIDHTDCLEEA